MIKRLSKLTTNAPILTEKLIENTLQILQQGLVPSLLDILQAGAIGFVIGLAVIPCLLVILLVFGFTCAGVAAGSYAAIGKGEIGDVQSGSCFSCCQSIAMSPMTYKLIPVLGLVGFIL